MSEHDTQVSIVQFLDLVLPIDIRVVAVANAPRSRVSGAFEKARGMKKGFPDLLLVGRLFCGLMEVKSAKGSLSADQLEWADWCGRHGVAWALVRGIDDVREALCRWGVEIREAKTIVAGQKMSAD